MYEGGNRVCIVDFSLGEKSLRKVGVCRRRERSYASRQVGSAGVLAFGNRYGDSDGGDDDEVSSASGIGDREVLPRERLDLRSRSKTRDRAMVKFTLDIRGYTRWKSSEKRFYDYDHYQTHRRGDSLIADCKHIRQTCSVCFVAGRHILPTPHCMQS